MKSAYAIMATAILLAIGGTFLGANVINGYENTQRVTGTDFAAITGEAVTDLAHAQQVRSLVKAVSSVLFGLISIAALVAVARVGSKTIRAAKENSGTPIEKELKKAEKAVQEKNLEEAYTTYNMIRQIYAQLEQKQKGEYYDRTLQLYRNLAEQATMAEAHRLTEKYVNDNITEEEYRRLQQIIASQ